MADQAFGTIDRRQWIGGVAALALSTASRADTPDITFLAQGLLAPEGPRMLASGDLLVCQLGRGELTRVDPNGHLHRVVNCGGSPNGVAIGPDGAAYVCNSGGFHFDRVDGAIVPRLPSPDLPPNGSIQRVDLATGAVRTLFDTCAGQHFAGPNDIIFDAHGGMWFTDSRFPSASGDETGAVFYAARHRKPRFVARVGAANGIAISPDGRTLYVVRSMKPSGIYAFTIAEPGRLVHDADGHAEARLLPGNGRAFDSLAVEAGGNLVLGTLFRGCLTVLSPEGALVEEVMLPDRFVTNVGFGGPEMRTAYATLTTTGRIARIAWPRPGLRPAFW